jgi:hypothetical protein
VHAEFSRGAGDAHAWTDAIPDWSLLSGVGTVTGYWRWHSEVPASASRRGAAWGYRAGFGGHGEYGFLGATFEPHEYPYLQVSVVATRKPGGRAAKPFQDASVGLPHDYVGGVLIGALQEPDRAGPGRLTFNHAAVHEIDSSWEVFRLLAIGVVRLLSLPSEVDEVPQDLLPLFGGSRPESPRAD